MRADRDTRDRWARLLDGEALPAEERAALIAAAERDPALRAALLDDGRLDGWLRARAWVEQDGARWVDRFAARLEAEREGAGFVAAVAARLPARAPRRAWALAAIAGAAALVLVAIARRAEHAPAPRAPALTSTAPARSAAEQPRAPVPPPSAVTGPRERLRFYDFEDGRQPAAFRYPPERRCPPRPGNRHCMMARKNPDTHRFPNIVGVRVEDRAAGLFVHQPGAVIAFDYWIGEWVGTRTPGVSVWFENRTQGGAPYYFHLPDVRAGQWVQVEIPVEAFRPQRPGPGVEGMRPGDLVDFLLIDTSWATQDVLYVDNLEFARRAPAP